MGHSGGPIGGCTIARSAATAAGGAAATREAFHEGNMWMRCNIRGMIVNATTRNEKDKEQNKQAMKE